MTSNSAGPRRQMVVAALVLAVCGTAAVSLQAMRAERFGRSAATGQMLYVTSPAAVTRAALSFDAIVADLYWIRSMQYYGGTRLSADPNKNYDLLYPLLDLTTSLDPQFSIAYRFGAFFLSEEPPGGAGRPDLAIRLLQKAMAANPTRWEYPHDVGFVYYRQRDYKRAAEWFLKASELPDATPWLKPVAGVILAGAGDTASSRAIWRSLLESDIDWIRSAAERRMLQLDAIDAIAQLERIVAEFQRRAGRPPSGWHDLIAVRLLPGVPLDPAGVPFVLDPSTARVTVSATSSLSPLPTDPPS